MKCKRILLSTLILNILFLSFTHKYEIGSCYISFKNPSGLVGSEPDRLPETAVKTRTVKTGNGAMDVITCIDGYRILYNNRKKAPFINMKVELSEKKFYDQDKKNLINNLKYLNTQSTSMETKDLIELEFNGYKIYGLNRSSIETGSILGTFVMFPGKGVTVYFYFNNLRPEYRTYRSIEEYKKQRDKFLDEYTEFLTTCKDK